MGVVVREMFVEITGGWPTLFESPRKWVPPPFALFAKGWDRCRHERATSVSGTRPCTHISKWKRKVEVKGWATRPGSTTFGGAQFDPKPSTGPGQDIANAKYQDNITHVEASAATKTVYIYNGNGVQAQIALDAFPRKKERTKKKKKDNQE